MAGKKILFVGKGNSVNSELFQALDQHFDMNTCIGANNIIAESIQLSKPSAIIVSLIGSDYNYVSIFELVRKQYGDIPVITIGTEYESQDYNAYYQMEQFHKMIRPIAGEELVAKCNAIVGNTKTEETVCEEKPHILVVDDNAMVLRNVKSLLEDRYSVAVAASGSQALVSIGKKKPNIILLDYEMPVLDGQATMEIIQKDDELKDIPIVFLTSVATKEVVTKLLSLKPAGYILKPASKEKLVEIIEKELNRN